MTTRPNLAYMRLARRAEVNDRATLVSTFVDVGPLFTLLSGYDHQILYGRRGTGKTHAFFYLAEIKKNEGDVVTYVDLRNLGSTGGIYSDQRLPIKERATRLLVDTLQAIHERLLEYFVEHAEEMDLSRVGPRLDHFAESITSVQVVGEVEQEKVSTRSRQASQSLDTSLTLDTGGPSVSASANDSHSGSSSEQVRTRESGPTRHYVHFGAVRKALQDIIDALGGKRLWLLLDEWSNVPYELQPYLADLIRRSIFPVRNQTTKIAAIEQRSNFRIARDAGDYVGIEIGADAAADINLDDFMVFDNDAERARGFFKQLLHSHVRATGQLDDWQEPPANADELLQRSFTRLATFDELVRAAEGVPRDAINVLSLAAQQALDSTISIRDVRKAARKWYQRDKEAALKGLPRAHALLHWVIDEVIGERRARAFLFRANSTAPLIDDLFDARVLHILKRNVSTHDQPGVRYDVYKLDYGCYVDLITTAKEPQGLLPIDGADGEVEYAEVPQDDYRSIRRAILELGAFDEHYEQHIEPQR